VSQVHVMDPDAMLPLHKMQSFTWNLTSQYSSIAARVYLVACNETEVHEEADLVGFESRTW
jgi:hypothetical protein